jgi:type VI protein secretion system component Hcp
MLTPKIPGIRSAAPILILSTCLLLFGTTVRAQTGGYMRAVTSHGAMAGGSTDPKYNGWIPLRQATMPSAPQMAALAEEAATSSSAAAGKSVHPPIVVVKDRDDTSLALLGACTSHQHFPEIDIAVMNPGDQLTARYKLTDATIISVRVSDPADGMHQPVELVRINYSKIEVQQ